MIKDIALLVNQYQDWLKDKTAIRKVNDHIEITTPFIDRHNDFIQIYARPDEGGYLLTDAGCTIEDLAMSGCLLDAPKRQELLKVTLAGFGVKEEGGTLLVHATEESFSLKQHSLIQSILAVNDLFYLAQPYVASLFLEDVAVWFDEIDARYIRNPKFSGKSGYDHVFNFVISKSKTEPERLIRAINHPTKDKAQSFAFSWVDTRDARPSGSKAYAILNDGEQKISSNVSEALKSYEIDTVIWGGREQAREKLAA